MCMIFIFLPRIGMGVKDWRWLFYLELNPSLLGLYFARVI